MQNVEDKAGDMQPVWNGNGDYVAFPSTSGGGGGYVAPVQPNPFFTPSSYITDNSNNLKIVLSSRGGAAEFLENGINKGIGENITINYSPSLTFGNTREYKANIAGKTSLNYFVVSVQKKYNTNYTITNSSGQTSYNNYNNYNYSLNTSAYNPIPFQQPVANRADFTYAEQLSIQEYTYNSTTGQYTLLSTKSLDSVSGTIPLSFTFQTLQVKALEDVTPIIVDSYVDYEISFGCNFQNELGNILRLKYNITDKNGNILEDSSILLTNLNTSGKRLRKSELQNGTINFSIVGDLPAGYSYKGVYYAPYSIASQNKDGDFGKWSKTINTFSIPANNLLGNIAVAVTLEKVITIPKPTISIPTTKIDKQVKDSDKQDIINVSFTTTDADFVDAYLPNGKSVRVDATKGFVPLYFQQDFDSVYGSKKVILVAVGNKYGYGDRVELLVNWLAVNDFPSITQITAPNVIDIPSFSDSNIEFDVIYNSFAVTSVDVDLLAKDNSRISLFKSLSPNGSFKINLRDLSTKFSNWNGNSNITLVLKPYNRGGEVELVGNEYETIINLNYPSVIWDETSIKTTLFDAFLEHLTFIEPEKESKHLTHLVNFGDDVQNLISSWEIDNWTLSKKSKDELGNEMVKPEDVVESIILKLYTPLNSNIVNNSTFWITKLMTNPLIETVVLNKQDDLKCPPIKGPNFGIEVDYVKGQSTNFESLDSLILNAPANSSSELISAFLSSSIIDTDGLNIKYTDGTDYLWNNFVHFSSAKERVDNFVYKVQLIELYEDSIITAETNWSGSHDDFTYLTGISKTSISSIQEVERQRSKKEQLIQSFDGFEKLLYTSSSYTTSDSGSLTWPYKLYTTGPKSGSIARIDSDNVIVKDQWYPNLIKLAERFDIENPNFVKNNIPQYIVNGNENDSLLLFFSMIGQHFDNIYFHTKAIEKSRSMGYKSKDGMSDKLLFDALKSMSWNAENLAADAKLWSYVFGMDSDGNKKETNPAKQRTYEVWRRIANNLPYLLKHKGTRRGIYALMSCYGIPSSNLSILEFGGPEVTEISKSKLVLDNITTALKMTNNSFIDIPWKETDKLDYPNTIELFVKPDSADNYNLISGSGWNVQLQKVDDTYGNVVFNYGFGSISTTTLPIYNGNFFGIEISRELNLSYSNFELNVRQSNKERTIFQESVSASVLSIQSNWENGNSIAIGKTYEGSVDEFRLWSTKLNKERFYEHVSFPEMINGNHISSSTDDLYFRLDFEYPKDLSVYNTLPNVDTNIYFENGLSRNDYELGSNAQLYSENVEPILQVTAHNFISSPTYPFNFEAIDRTVVMDYPDGGASRFQTSKVRFEEQTLVSDLSSKHRATKKAFDQAPTDSNRVGLFFSPTKELNMDIAKSFGGLNIDNYIGDPSDSYKSNYSNLDSLRNYYFQRFDGRDIYAYINLIKLYEKSMFEDIKKMLPARVKATTGLLIEPHFLERSKVAHKKPTGENEQLNTEIHYGETTILKADNEQYEALITSSLFENLVGENEQLDSLIVPNDSTIIRAENNQLDSLIVPNDDVSIFSENEYYELDIDAGLGEPTIQSQIDTENSNQTIGGSAYEDVGFGIYTSNGFAIRTYYDKDNRLVKQRVRATLVTTQKEKDVVVPKIVINGIADPRGGYTITSSVYNVTELVTQTYSGSILPPAPTVGGNIISVEVIDGYLPTHNKFVSDLSTGQKNSYYLGSKNTIDSTIDGASPVETFITNPNTLKVNKAGRDASEPILNVE